MLKNKKILITGIANKFSIANGIAQSMSKNGAELAFAYQNERLLKKIKPIATTLNNVRISFADLSPIKGKKSLIDAPQAIPLFSTNNNLNQL